MCFCFVYDARFALAYLIRRLDAKSVQRVGLEPIDVLRHAVCRDDASFARVRAVVKYFDDESRYRRAAVEIGRPFDENGVVGDGRNANEKGSFRNS